MGDPGGIGPEIVLKAIAQTVVREQCNPVVVGSRETFGRAAEVVKLPMPEHLTEPLDLERGPFSLEKVDAKNGAAAAACIRQAVQMVGDGRADAICTAPISKEAFFQAGVGFPGHTEMLSALCGGCDVRMMLEGGGLHVVLQTIHVALSRVPALLSIQAILDTLVIADGWARRHGESQAIAVCGLNPHAGEGGHFGHEELEIVAPAIEQARARGIDASGPFAADTVFHSALLGEFGLVLAMYHDQGLIPVKTLAFDQGVNVTLGLPIVRTSPDHGTAFGLAGKGTARENSMVAAILRAAELSRVQR